MGEKSFRNRGGTEYLDILVLAGYHNYSPCRPRLGVLHFEIDSPDTPNTRNKNKCCANNQFYNLHEETEK